MLCEYCNTDHNGDYGSGRFCNSKCARGFSTRNKREEINKKVSKKLKGNKQAYINAFKFGFDPRRKPNCKIRNAKISNSIKEFHKLRNQGNWDDVSTSEKYRRIYVKQNGKCLWCGIGSTWNEKPLKLEIDHVNGDHSDNSEDNLRYLCPNCHSQTPTWKKKKSAIGANLVDAHHSE